MKSTRVFSLAGWRGEVRESIVAENRLEAAVRRLSDPGQAQETLHWGRNYLYTIDLSDLAEGRADEVVVKQFSNRSRRARWKRRWRGSKAEKSWKAARVLLEAGIRTPDPLFLIEAESADGPSLYVTGRLEDFVESRYYFRAIARGTERADFPGIDRAELMAAIGDTFRRVHAAGVWHRDLSIGNLLVRTGKVLEIFLIDLDRSRLRSDLGAIRRLRDISRLPILDRADRRSFWRAYWGRDLSLSSGRGLVFRMLQQTFLAKNRWKPRLRRPLRTVKSWLVPRSTYAHIPEAPGGASARDKAVWDHLSDQPHQHASRRERMAIRLVDASAHTAAITAAVGSAPRIWKRYRDLMKDGGRRPRRWLGAGVALRPLPGREEELLAAVERLGVRRLLLRLHPWQRDHKDEEALARELVARGYELAFALPQNRELVRDPGRWRGSVAELADRFRPLGGDFQIGQAINRSKWGIWNYREYLRLAAIAREVFSAHPGGRLIGPAVIDFELQVTAAVLNMTSEAYFDVVSSLLYVDRRGAPENRQLGFDTVAKCALLKAIAETSRNSGDECWITEVNWPLWEGPHSPAGRTVSVDEETQADYLTRYYLLSLTSGFVERVYWWQLAARGYGLLDPAEKILRERPSFRALATLEGRLAGATFVESASPSATTRGLLFEVGNRKLLVAWSLAGPETVTLEAPFERAVSRDGVPRCVDPGLTVELESSPVYLELAEASASGTR
ncbi:MAG: hypothetical protein GY769_00725 [bacterium]|nr:hypothetical protein [bacterium]